MSRLHKEETTCPDCHYIEDTTIWDVVLVKEDPDLKEEILLKKLQSFYCSNCQAHYVLEKSFLYVDEEKQVLIYYAPDLKHLFQEGMLKGLFTLPSEIEAGLPEQVRKLAQNKNWKLRLCLEYNDVIEKIHLFDHGLEDDVMEVLKLAIRSRLTEEEKFAEKIYFISADTQQMIFQAGYADAQWEHLDLALSMYQNAEKVLKLRLPETKGLCLRDENFALEFVKTQNM